jgi:hypothetical protein
MSLDAGVMIHRYVPVAPRIVAGPEEVQMESLRLGRKEKEKLKQLAADVSTATASLELRGKKDKVLQICTDGTQAGGGGRVPESDRAGRKRKFVAALATCQELAGGVVC